MYSTTDNRFHRITWTTALRLICRRSSNLSSKQSVVRCDSDQMSRDVRKPDFCTCENKAADQLCGNRTADFATQIVQSLYFLNPNLQASSHFLWLPSPVCVGPGRKPRRPVFSRHGSNFVSCRHLVYPNNLPPASIIIIFRDELFSILLRTIYSIVANTPDHLIQEIILVDDGSTLSKNFILLQ